MSIKEEVGLDYFDHIYVINLDRCRDRKQHIIEEFSRVGISDYEFFSASDKSSSEVIEMYKSGRVKRFPPCFRCGENSCDHENNIVIPEQVGNWCSFINLMKDIIKNNYKHVLICEDDVKFAEHCKTTFDRFINLKNFKKYNIDLNKPILIRYERRSRRIHWPPVFGYLRRKIEERFKFWRWQHPGQAFIPRPVYSNACFSVNKQYAESFLEFLPEIKYASDGYIQVDILNKDPSIQHFTVLPAPAYQLSDHEFPQMRSEIIPRGYNEADIIRKANHTKGVKSKEEYDTLFNKWINNE